MSGLTDINIGNFSELHLDTADDGSFATKISNIQSLTHPSDEANIIEVAEFGQNYPRKLVGSHTTGNAEVVVNFNPSLEDHKELSSLYASGESKKWQIRVLESKDSTVYSFYEFDGRVASKTAAGEFDSVLTVTFSLAIDGEIGDWQDAVTP